MNILQSFSRGTTLRPDVVGEHLASSVAAMLPTVRAFAEGDGQEFGIGQRHLPPKYRMSDGSILHPSWSIVSGRVPSFDLFLQQKDRQTTIRFMDADICDVDDDAAIRSAVMTLMEGAEAACRTYLAHDGAPEGCEDETLAVCLHRDEEVRRRIPEHPEREDLPRMTILHDQSAMVEHPSPWTGGGFRRLVWMDPDEQLEMDRPYLDAVRKLVGVDAVTWSGSGSEMGFSIMLQPHRQAFLMHGIDPVRRMRLMAVGRELLDHAAGGKTK